MMIRERACIAVVVLLAASTWYALSAGERRIDTATRLQRDFLARAVAQHRHHQALARAIEDRIARGEEQEQIPPPWGTRNPGYVAAWDRPPIVLPPSPFAWIAAGSSDVVAPGFYGPGHEEITEVTSPLRLLTGHVDVLFVATNLLSAAILVVFVSLAAAGHGVDHLAAAQGASRWQLAAARGTATMIAVVGTALGALAVAVPLLQLPWTIDTIARIALLAVAITLYGLFWVAVGVLVQARSSPEAQIVAAFAAWVAIVALAPFAIDRLAAAWRPIPPRTAAIEIGRTASARVAEQNINNLIDALLRRHPDFPRPETLAPLGRMYLEGTARSEARDALIAAAEEEAIDAARTQQRFVDRLSVASPAALLTRVLTALAGTDRERYDRFLQAKAAFDREYARMFGLKRFALPESVFHADEYDQMPVFSYQDAPLIDGVAR